MKGPKMQKTGPMDLKQKLMSAMVMLLLAAILVSTASFAWFELANAPEAKYIAANVGANGSLEIALLNTQTYSDLSRIRSDIGDSLASDNQLANSAWGNLVDLGIRDYGLQEISLLPARLNVMANGADGGYMVDSGILAVPTYGYDGRIVELSYNAVSAIYRENDFSLVDGVQDFGVRGIGTSDILSAQGTALALAKSNISASYLRIRSSAVVSMESSGNALFNILLFHMLDPETTYADEDRDTLKGVLDGLDGVIGELDAALRQGLVAFAAAGIGDEQAFQAAKDQILDLGMELRQVLDALPQGIYLPEKFEDWVTALDDMQNDLNQAAIECDRLSGGTYTWQQIRRILDYIMNVNQLQINNISFNDLDFDLLLDMIGQDIVLTLAKGSGIYADIAEFVDDYRAIISLDIAEAMVIADNEGPTSHLAGLTEAVMGLKAAEGSMSGMKVPLTATYGYALDLAFRCNTDGADLLLQTMPRQRIYNQEGQESTSASTLGGGSYMAFQTFDKQLADAIRVGFLDDQGTLLGIAKLDTGDRGIVNDMVQMPLYLYDYEFEADDAGMYLKMEDQPRQDATIVSSEDMYRNVAKAVTVVVWLDGDLVDNTMVSAAEETSLSGVMNLQFATSARLVPLRDGALMNYTADKSGLQALLAQCEPIAAAGRGDHTTVSWQAFSAAVERAKTVLAGDTFRDSQVRDAIVSLAEAKEALEIISRESVTGKVRQLREQMGVLEGETARLVIQNKDGSFSAVGNEAHTQQEHDSWNIVGQINRVDYSRNLKDEGNGVYVSVYSEDSWDTMAGALYAAEAVLQNPDSTDEQLNAALSAMEAAENNLERQVYFKPYVYQNTIYYEAICKSDDADTYGKWYDAGFRRILSDLTIVNLDAYAQPAEIAGIRQPEYVASDTAYINPEILLEEIKYPQLQDEKMKGVQWNTPDPELFTELMTVRHLSAINSLLSIVADEQLNVDTTAAKKLAAEFSGSQRPTAEAAASQIRKLNEAVVAALAQKAEAEAAAGTDMTDNQRTLLITAVSVAKAVDGYDETDRTDLNTLRSRTRAAEALLNAGTVVTKSRAATVLSELNVALRAVNAGEVTEYNTLKHKLPDGAGAADILYDKEYPDIFLQLKGKSGTSTINAQILTENGVLYSVNREIVIYDRADGLQLCEPETAVSVTSLNVMPEDIVDLSAALLYEENGKNTGDKKMHELTRERIKSVLWASADTQIATVAGKESAVCTITAVAAGKTEISAAVQTVEGNTYTCSIPLYVQ